MNEPAWQDTLFDVTRPEPTPLPLHQVDEARLSQIAFLYTATELGNATGIKFGATLEDAKKWCTSPVSRGSLHGTRWAYFWTSALNYCRYHSGDLDTYGGSGLYLDLRGLRDNGLWDERLAAAGVKKIPLAELGALVAACAVTVEMDPAVAYLGAAKPVGAAV